MSLEKLLTEIEEARAKATDGIWTASPGDSYCAYPSVVMSEGKKQFIVEDHDGHDGHDPGECPRKCDSGSPGKDEDVKFISIAANRILDLVAIVRLQRAELVGNLKYLESCGYEKHCEPHEPEVQMLQSVRKTIEAADRIAAGITKV